MTSNNYNPDDLDKLFHLQTVTSNQEAFLSIAAIEDRLVQVISSHNTAEIDEDEIHAKWHYLDQAEALIYRINGYDPLPEFVIFTEHIPEELGQALESLGKVTMNKIITNAVRRLRISRPRVPS